MAVFPDDDMRRDGIQLGGPHTLCYKCELERMAKDRDSDIPYGKLQYKEVFKINQGGLDTCLCMRHFKEMCETSHYMLVDTNEFMIVPLAAMEEEVEAETEEPVVEEQPKEEEEKPKKKSDKKKKEDK